MPMKKYKPEQIVTLLLQIEVEIANGKTTPQACRDAQITAQTFYRWRKEVGGLKLDQAKRLKELERENGKLKRLVAELSLEKQILKDVAEGRGNPSGPSQHTEFVTRIRDHLSPSEAFFSTRRG